MPVEDFWLVDADFLGDHQVIVASEDSVYLAAAESNSLDPVYEDPESVEWIRGSPDGESILIGRNQSPSLRLWSKGQDVVDALPETAILGETVSADISRDGHWAAVSDRKGNLVLLDLKTNPPREYLLATFTGEYCRSVQFSADMAWLMALMVEETKVKVWDFRKYRLYLDAIRQSN